MTISEQRIEAAGLEWFYRECLPLRADRDRPPVVLLHGLVSQSYSWRKVMPELAEQGLRAIAPDWIGHGFSSHPAPKDFAYTADAFISGLGSLLDALALEKVHLVAQGFLGAYGCLYALRHPNRIGRLVVVNVPLTGAAKLPASLRRMTWPLAGEMMTQDPLLVDRTLEGGGPYQVGDADLDVYRKPFLTTSAAGRSLLATLRNYKTAAIGQEIETACQTWTHPTLGVWGMADPWLPLSLAEQSFQTLANGELAKLDQVGHYAQEDWPEKVTEVIVPFLRKTSLN